MEHGWKQNHAPTHHTPHTQCVEQSKSSDDGFVMDKSDDRVYLSTSIVDKYI